MGLESSEATAVRQVPKSNRCVITGAEEDLTVGSDGERTHPGGVAFQCPLFSHMGHVEQLDRLVTASGDEQFGIGGEGHRTDPIVHRFLKSTVVFDEVPACFTGFIVFMLPVAVMQDFVLSAG